MKDIRLPGWLPRWLIQVIGFITGNEFAAGLQCERCGRVIDLPDDATQSTVDCLLDAHERFFHSEAA